MAEYSRVETQTVAPGESATFDNAVVPCNRGFIRWRADSGAFNLSGSFPRNYRRSGCCCRRNNTNAMYEVEFQANVAIPTGETPSEISMSLAVDGVTLPESTRLVTPTAADAFFSISGFSSVPVWRGCCQTVTLRNTGTTPITVQNLAIRITRPDLAVTY